MKFNINKEKVGQIVKTGSNLLVFGLMFVSPYIGRKEIVDTVRYSCNVKYSDAVEVVLQSTMFSGDKTKAIAMIPKDKDSDFYKSVIAVMKSNLFSGDKLKMLNKICEDLEEGEES